jgi:hypothetical protein
LSDDAKPTVAVYRGARGSNTGDYFHELWALQQALDLLDPSSDLRAVTVEGIASDLPVTKSSAAWDGVDCALYYGRESLETADRLEIVQLKYSGSSPHTPWTVARLTYSTKATGNNSVLRRLADDFVRARKHAKPTTKISVRLISNQPLAPDAAKALLPSTEIADSLVVSEREKIEQATGLKNADLAAFLTALDLSGCGSPSLLALREAVAETLAEAIGSDVIARLRELQTHIRELMLPTAARETITFKRVLGWFGISDEQGLFPAPSALVHHLEWHAMFVVAGELIRSEPLLRAEDDYDRYEEWIVEHLVSEPPVWLADRRDPVPLDPRLWYEDLAKDRYWLRTPPRSEFLHAVIPADASENSFLTICGNWTAGFPKREVNTLVMTALVSPDTASSLLRALQTVNNPYDYKIPDEDDDAEIREGSYSLVGWISELQRSRRLDSHDPFAHEVSTLAAKPGKLAMAHLKLQPVNLPLKEWCRVKENRVAFRYLSWDDRPVTYDDRSRPRVAATRGYRLELRADTLLEFLNAQQMDLIVEITIERRIENEYPGNYDWEAKKHKNFDKVILLRRSGEIEDVTGRIGAWPKTRQ